VNPSHNKRVVQLVPGLPPRAQATSGSCRVIWGVMGSIPAAPGNPTLPNQHDTASQTSMTTAPSCLCVYSGALKLEEPCSCNHCPHTLTSVSNSWQAILAPECLCAIYIDRLLLGDTGRSSNDTTEGASVHQAQLWPPGHCSSTAADSITNRETTTPGNWNPARLLKVRWASPTT